MPMATARNTDSPYGEGADDPRSEHDEDQANVDTTHFHGLKDRVRTS
jgi:hypothetical protein